MFFPFPFATPKDRCKTLECLWAFRRDNRAVPEALGVLLGRATEDDLRRLFVEVKESPKALEVLGFFHGLHCDGEPCLGSEIAKTLEKLGAKGP